MAARVCWRCGTKAHHTIQGPPICVERALGETIWSAAFQCDECQVLSIGTAFCPTNTHTERDAQEILTQHTTKINWQPTNALGRDYPEVPEQVASAADEAHRCHSIGAYRSSILMARSALEATAKDCDATKGDLKAKINALHDADKLNKFVSEQAHEIRFFGNEMAHGDFVVPVTEEESSEILGLMAAVLEQVYQEPVKLEQLRQARLARESAQKE